jgi:hypothetical protein
MSRFTTAILTLKKIVSSAIETPRGTVNALKLVPSAARGLSFGGAPFPRPPERPTSAPTESNPLLSYFNAHTKGPGLWKWLHYFDIYHRHFSKFVGQEVHVLEIGIYSGGSLGMWREYFGTGCHIYGVDIEPACMTYKSDGIDVFIGDQSDRNFWKRFRDAVPRVDILIDDGGHAPEQQRITLEEMLPHIQPGGVYLCEDICGVANSFSAYVSGLASNLNTFTQLEQVFDSPVTPTSLQSSIRSITHYPLITVIEKHAYDQGIFISRKHGTEWQPY